MAGEAGDLMAMVRRLAAMSEPDRSFILTALDQREARDLDRLLRQVDEGAMSPVLRDLAAECAVGGRSIGITDRAALAIAKAASSQATKPRARQTIAGSPSLMARLFTLVTGR